MDDSKKQFPPNIPERLRGLNEIATNLWWSWHPAARMLFKMLDRQIWKESGHNPVQVLSELPGEILEEAAHNQEYLRHYDSVLEQFRQDQETKENCFLERLPDAEAHFIAYFSAEYGLHSSLPFYAGGLGFLAGDYH